MLLLLRGCSDGFAAYQRFSMSKHPLTTPCMMRNSGRFHLLHAFSQRHLPQMEEPTFLDVERNDRGKLISVPAALSYLDGYQHTLCMKVHMSCSQCDSIRESPPMNEARTTPVETSDLTVSLWV